MLKKLARKILREEIAKLENEYSLLMKEYEEAQRLLDKKKETSTLSIEVQTAKDLPFNDVEKAYLREQSNTPTLTNILDKILVNAIAGLAMQEKPATQEDAQRIQNIRLAYALVKAEIRMAAGEPVQVDPRTTEIREE